MDDCVEKEVQSNKYEKVAAWPQENFPARRNQTQVHGQVAIHI